MQLKALVGGLVFSLFLGTALHAQDPQPPVPEAAKPPAVAPDSAPAVPDKVVLKEGAGVNLKFAQDLSSLNVCIK
jgi:hypothetical protein